MHSKLQLAAIISAALAVAAILPANAAKVTPEQFVGTWVGAWNENASIELRVHHIDADNNVYGNYCWISNGWFNFFDAHPEDGFSVTLKNGKIRWRFNERRWALASEETTKRRCAWSTGTQRGTGAR